MDLPPSITAIGEQLDADREIVADPQLLSGADVFAAERQRLFLRPWVAVDHQSRIGEPGRYVRFEAATRSILLVTDAGGRLRALRNVCIHAGYPVCEAEEGSAERLVCPYHGWEFAADGRLLEPDLSSRIDPARLRLASHPVRLRDGLIFVDLSKPAAADDSEDPPIAPGAMPGWLADAVVTRRERHSTEWNWKLALQFVRSARHLFTERPDDAALVVFGPLSLMLTEPDQATLLRLMPRSAGHTDIQLTRMAARDIAANGGSDCGAGQWQSAATATAAAETEALLDRAFYGWYWSLMAAD
jgi:nitrite reductase/ring-hydroxylating ferredoxin subunit